MTRLPNLPERGLVLAFSLVATVVALDRALKLSTIAFIDEGSRLPAFSPVQLVHTENSGAAFGLLSDWTLLLIGVGLIGVIFLVAALWRTSDRRRIVPLSLMLGGATANLWDRVVSGQVVDSLKIPHWPAFNIADSAITLGVALLISGTAQLPKIPRLSFLRPGGRSDT